MRITPCIVFCLFAFFAAPGFSTTQHIAKVVIIIDDLGNNDALSMQAVHLPAPVICSILPQTPFAYEIDKAAVANHKEIILHVPMQPIHWQPLGPGGLTINMSQTAFLNTLEQDLNSVPDAFAISNHMGSLMTQNQKNMNWLMIFLQQHHLAMMDSVTIHNSVAYKTARRENIPAAYRSVFLDDIVSTSAVTAQFQQLIIAAKKNGLAIAIGHPNRVTLNYLETAIPQLAKDGIEVIPLSQAVVPQNLSAQTRMQTAALTTIAPQTPAFYQEPMTLSVKTTLTLSYWLI